MTSEFTRRSFLVRSAVLVGALAGVRAFSPSEPAAVAAPLAMEPPLNIKSYVSEFWVESSSPNVMELAAMHGDELVVSHMLPPHSGFYMQYPFGRRVQVDHFVVNGEPVAFDAVSFKRHDFPDERHPSMVYVNGTAVDCVIGAVWEE